MMDYAYSRPKKPCKFFHSVNFDLQSKYPQFGGLPNAAQLQRAAALMHMYRLRNIALFRNSEKCGRKRLRFLHQLHSKVLFCLQDFCTLL